MYIPDNYDMFCQHDAEQERNLEKLPICICCNEYIQDDYYYEIDGELYCEDCMKEAFRKNVEDYEE